MVEYRNLGRTGMKVSNLCMGCMTFGKKTDQETACQMVDHAIEQGVNFFDTANVYNRGVSEEYLGEALARNGKRDQIVLATKVHGRMDDDDPNMQGNSRRHIIEQCEASLKRLRTDWIDLYQIHRPQSDIPIDETLRALDDLVRQGKVRHLGTSTFAAWQCVESLWAAKELGLNRFVCEQPPYHMLDRRIERELVPMAQTYGYGLIPWSPLAAGFLTGKYKRGQDRPDGSRLEGNKYHSDLFSDAGFDLLEKVEQLAKEKGCSISQLALAWNFSQPGITSPIIGARNMEQLTDNLGAFDVEVTEQDCKAIDELAPPGQAIATSYYRADFGPHAHRVL